MKKVTFNSVQYTSKFINENFRIKAYGLNALGEKINTLVGVSGAIALIGAELLVKLSAVQLRLVLTSACASSVVAW